MFSQANDILMIAALFDAAAAIEHLACIAIGGSAFRFLGAGERLAREFEAGKIQPILVTILIAFILFSWSAFALSGAGMLGLLPFTKWILIAISMVLITRALAFPLLKPYFPENSMKFWLISSGICFVMGMAHLYGVITQWNQL
ncbi:MULTISPECIES: hypothetical protein [unclassified Acinetobacter]|uniref:hypothetical protein n=1 Tax=unclassified Acinetobacter TaxID=196816 RepID=UPI0018A8BAB2|nr:MULTISPECIES: hypothetical protein [unclassified Acinetobacter]MBJ9952150.1 hypothetical protein [Acinetobacter baumannii]